MATAGYGGDNYCSAREHCCALTSCKEHCVSVDDRVWLRLRARTKRELEYRIPRLHDPVNSPRFPEIFGDFRKRKTIFL